MSNVDNQSSGHHSFHQSQNNFIKGKVPKSFLKNRLVQVRQFYNETTSNEGTSNNRNKVDLSALNNIKNESFDLKRPNTQQQNYNVGDKRLVLSRIQGRQIKKQRIESMKKIDT